MEISTDAILFLGAVVAGVTQAVKLAFPTINGLVTVGVALAVGVLVALVDVEIGLNDITVATGILTAFGTVGTFSAVDRVSK